MKWYIYYSKQDSSEIFIGLAETLTNTNYDSLLIKLDLVSMTATKCFLINRVKYTKTELNQSILDVIVQTAIFKLQPTAKWFEITRTKGEKLYVYASIDNYITTEGFKVRLKDVYIFKGKKKIKVDNAYIDLRKVETIKETSIEPMECFNVGDIYTWDDNYALILKKTELGYRIVMLVKDDIFTTTISFKNDFLDKIKYKGNIDIKNLDMRLIMTKFMNKING